MSKNLLPTFAVAVNCHRTLADNFLQSSFLSNIPSIQVLIQERFRSAAAAYNDALDKSNSDLIVFCHQDMYFPDQWLNQLDRALQYLRTADPNWGVLGCWGVNAQGKGLGHVYTPGLETIGKQFQMPQFVRTLDEIVLIFRKSSGLRFDESLPGFHMYGSDICLAADAMGMKNYAISAYCIHNSRQGFILPKAFYESCAYFRHKWWTSLPIITPCITVSRSNKEIYERKARELWAQYVVRRSDRVFRPQSALEIVERLGLETQGLKDIAQNIL